MSGNIKMIVNNAHDTATLTATSEALPATHTQRSGRSYAWRSTDTALQVIEAQFPQGGQHIDALVLYRHNLSSSAKARVELLDGTEVIYDSGYLPTSQLVPLGMFRAGVDPWGATFDDKIPVSAYTFWFQVKAATGYRVSIDDQTNADGYLQVGRVIAGLSFSPRINPSYGLTLEWRESVEHRRTEGGSLRSIGGSLARALQFDLNEMDEVDRARLTGELVKSGQSADVFISCYPEQGGVKEIEHAFLARRDSSYAHSHLFYGNWSTKLSFIEV